MPTTIDGQTVQEVTIDGQTVQEITVDGDVVYSAGETITIVDSFEHNDLAGNYSQVGNNYSITTNFATDGTNCLEFTGTTSIEHMRSDQGDGLSNYPSKPVEIEVDVQTNQGTSISDDLMPAFFFGVEDVDNYYMIRSQVQWPNLEIWKREAGSFTQIDVDNSASLSEWNANTTYTWNVKWDDGATFGGSDGDITVEVFDSGGTSIGSTTANDTTINGSGIGFRTQHAQTSYVSQYDYYRIIE